jgi:hypothetical protein
MHLKIIWIRESSFTRTLHGFFMNSLAFGSRLVRLFYLARYWVTDLQDCILHGLLIGEGGTLCELKWGGDRQDGCLVFSLDDQGQNRHSTSHSLPVTVERMVVASCLLRRVQGMSGMVGPLTTRASNP